MSEPRSLTESLRESIQARKEVHPMEFRVCNLEKKSREHELGLKGNNWQANLCVAECREATSEVRAMLETITSQNETIADLKAAVGSLQADLAAACERIENMAQWAKSKGKQ